MCFHKCIRYFNIMPVWNWNLWLFIILYRFYLVLGLNKSARYRLIIVITTHMINDCGSILVKDNGLYCSNCVDYVSQCIAMTVYLLVYIWYTMHWTMLEKVCVVHFENLQGILLTVFKLTRVCGPIMFACQYFVNSSFIEMYYRVTKTNLKIKGWPHKTQMQILLWFYDVF